MNCFIKIFSMLIFFVIPISNAQKLDIAFINPGNKGEVFWDLTTAFMKAAAEDLNINLEVLYSERDHLKMIEQAKEISQRKKKPSYVVIVNEKQVAGRMLEQLHQAGILVFLLLSDFTPNQKKVYGNPREKYKKWIGTLRADHKSAGFDIATTLIKHLRSHFSETVEAIGVAGDYITPASALRVDGLHQALKQNKGIILKQVIHSQWRQRKAYRQLRGLLRRYPKTKLVWTANDPMAIGAIQAAIERKFQPGKNIFIGGLNWSKEALDLIVKGTLTTSIGGHFMGGGWALVMVRDFHDGKDFLDVGLNQTIRMGVIDKSNVAEYLKYFGDQNWRKIDFTKFLRSAPGNKQGYRFNIARLFALQKQKNRGK